MKKLFQNQKVNRTFSLLRPWVTFVSIFLILYYSGALSGISVFAKTALLKTGLMDVDPEASTYDEVFDYNFTIKDMAGNIVDMNRFKGKTIFINLWATWCGPCVAEMPSIQRLYEKTDKDKVVFILLDWFEQPEKVSKFLTKKEFTFPAYLVNEDVPPQLNVSTIPTTFVISPDGRIVTKKTGTANYDTEKFRKFLETMKETL
jgi:thiol-disulfide isomerase/thioredoxin